MTEWALPAPTRRLFREASSREREAGGIGRFLSGGHFRQFLTRYPEAGLMYAKMMYTHVLVNQVRGDRYKKRAAQNELWKGQCHHAYWHGARGGVYSNPRAQGGLPVADRGREDHPGNRDLRPLDPRAPTTTWTTAPSTSTRARS